MFFILFGVKLGLNTENRLEVFKEIADHLPEQNFCSRDPNKERHK